TVSQRTREIGLRMALGAAPARVRAMVLRQVGVMTIVGGLIGLAAAVGLGRLAQSLLFQMQGWDPIVLTAAAVSLTLVALAAGSRVFNSSVQFRTTVIDVGVTRSFAPAVVLIIRNRFPSAATS